MITKWWKGLKKNIAVWLGLWKKMMLKNCSSIVPSLAKKNCQEEIKATTKVLVHETSVKGR